MSQASSTPLTDGLRAPSVAEIREARDRLGALVRQTPLVEWGGGAIEQEMSPETRVFLKLELLQFAGSFKPRGALCVMMAMTPEQLGTGVVAVSAGNHAIAVGYAAKCLGTTAKVVMPKTANPARVAACKQYGAEVLLTEDVTEAFQMARLIERDEGRVFVHPFEGPLTTLGTATLGLEMITQQPDLDAVLVPIGGGGLASGVGAAVKEVRPSCRVIGIEPKGADTMHRSFATGKCAAIKKIETIADSLGAPQCEPYSFALCRQFIDELVLIDDRQMCRAMAVLFKEMKLVVEPAGAVATAALLGPLRQRLAGQKVGVIVCGSNLDLGSFVRLVDAGLCNLDPSASIRPKPATPQPLRQIVVPPIAGAPAAAPPRPAS
jgi:threonine dehydratase